MSSARIGPNHPFPIGGGRTGKAIRSHDWTPTQLGPSAGWPSTLKAALGLILNSPESMFLAWGPNLLSFYNDAYVPMLGLKAQGALGKPMAELWSDIWDQISPIVEATLAGRASRYEDLPLTMWRSGVEEQTWWSFSYSPLVDEHGAVAALFCVTTETTERVLDGLKLRENQEVATVVAEVGEVGAWSIDLTTETCTLSGRMAALVDLAPEPTTMPASIWREWIHPEDRGRVEAALARSIENGRPYDVECRVSLGDGPSRWFRSHGGVVRDASGTAIRLQGASVDLTERKRAEERQREGQVRLASALSIAALGTFDWEVTSGRVTLDARSREIFGFAEGEGITAGEVFGRLHPSDVDRINDEAAAAVEAGLRIETEYRIALPDGTVRSVVSIGEAIPGPDGTTERMFGVFRDTTAQRRARDRQAFLLDLGDLLRALTSPGEVVSSTTRRIGEHLGVGRCAYGEVVDDGMTLVVERDWTDGRMSSFTGRLTLDDFGPDIIGELRAGTAVRCDDVLRDDRTRLAAKAFALVGGVRAGMAVPLVRDGTLRALVFVVADTSRAWSDDDETLLREAAERVWSALGRARAEERLRRTNESLEARVADAVAERLRSEEAARQSQKMEAVGQLTGGVAHDFNNLLTVIRSSVDLLAKPGLAEERRKRYVAAISDTVGRAAKLTGQLLAFARRQALKPEVFDVGRSVSALGEMAGTLTGSRIRVTIQVPDEPCHVDADTGQFDTALVNLVVNARDAMDEQGRLDIAVRAVPGLPAATSGPAVPGGYVAVSLTDTGSGIPADQVERIFEPFFTTKGVGKGTGLGLSQVFGFVKQSGGEVVVDSEVGRGTTFTLYLPRVEADGPSDGVDATDGGSMDGHGLSVLVVEDSEAVGTSTTQALVELGHATVWALDAESALDELAQDSERFDVVFSDVIMPGMNGIDLAREIRRLYRGLPVVLASGYSQVLAQDAGHGFELLHKPYSVEDLSRTLLRVGRRGKQSGGVRDDIG